MLKSRIFLTGAIPPVPAPPRHQEERLCRPHGGQAGAVPAAGGHHWCSLLPPVLLIQDPILLLPNVFHPPTPPSPARKKETTAEKLADTRSSLAGTEEEIREKKQHVSSFAGETVLR